MILHIINKSPLTHSCFNECIAVCSDACSLLFIEDGVYATTHLSNETQNTLKKKNIKLYALEPDIEARGIINKVNEHFTVIDDKEFVELITTHHSSQSWY